MTKQSFKGTGYALYETLQQCENSVTSIEFITERANSLLMYNGPIRELAGLDPQDFMVLQLLNGYPELMIDHGTGSLTLRLDGADSQGNSRMSPLNDGKWHRIDIRRQGKVMSVIYARLCGLLNYCMFSSTCIYLICNVISWISYLLLWICCRFSQGHDSLFLSNFIKLSLNILEHKNFQCSYRFQCPWWNLDFVFCPTFYGKENLTIDVIFVTLTVGHCLSGGIMCHKHIFLTLHCLSILDGDLDSGPLSIGG